MKIEDGTGKGYGLKIDDENRAITRSITEPRDFHANLENGKVWSLPFGPQDPTGAGDYVFYLKNTGDKDISVTDFRLSCTGAASQILITGVTGTAADGSTITPVNRNLGSAETVTATAEEGVNITGITSSGTLFFMELDTVSKLYHLSTSANIIIPKGSAIGISVTTATCVLSGVVSVVEQE